MHRTQLMLEDKQYEFLKHRSAQERKSISQIVREFIDICAENSDTLSLSSIEGIAEDPGAYGRDHDRLLYRKR